MNNEVDPPPSAIDVLRKAQREVLLAHGPCCTSCESLLDARARQLLQESTLDALVRSRLMDEIRMILGIREDSSTPQRKPLPA